MANTLLLHGHLRHLTEYEATDDVLPIPGTLQQRVNKKEAQSAKFFVSITFDRAAQATLQAHPSRAYSTFPNVRGTRTNFRYASFQSCSDPPNST